MSGCIDLRHYMKIVEGDFIPTVPYTLKLETGAYDLVRMLMKIVNPATYHDATDYQNKSVVMFYDEQQYKHVQKMLRGLGIKFQTVKPETTGRDIEHREPYTLSPYPSNTAIRRPIIDI